MSVFNYITLALSGVAAALPTFSGLIPQPYGALASGIIAAVAAAIHLYMPAPASK
jgi:hypothetical protein